MNASGGTIDLSIIILAYKSKEHLEVLLPSIWASQTKYACEIIVVDNGSGDGTAEFAETWLQARGSGMPEKFRGEVIRNTNAGFAKGNNLALVKARGRYYLILNPDTRLGPETVEVMVNFMDQTPRAGIAGCKLVKANGKLDLACRRRFPNPWNSFKRLFAGRNADYNYSDRAEDEVMEVDSVVGAFMVVRREMVDDIGFFDEAFFMYGEDLDYCWRAKEAGWQVWYYPKTTVLHYKGESSKRAPFRMLKVFHDAMWIFYKKHYWQRYPLILNGLVWVGIYGRLALLSALNLFKKERRVSK